jgi:hypothetical protein
MNAMKDNLQARKTKERQLKVHKELLVESVRKYVLPAFAKMGFEVVPRIQGSSNVDRKSEGIFPLGSLRRARIDGGADLVEVQFMTYGRAAFRINACAVPKQGIRTLAGQRTADQIEAGGLHDHFEMYEYPRVWKWFALWLWRFRQPNQAAYDNLAVRVAGFVSEIERAITEGQLGPHMRRISFQGKVRGSDLKAQGPIIGDEKA